METAVELDESDSKKYKIKAICDSKVYAKKSNNSHLSDLYYWISWKDYTKEENIWEPISTVLHLHKLISIFYHDHPEKLTVSPPTDSALPMARPIVRPAVRSKALNPKQKRGRLAKTNNTNKRTKKSWAFGFLFCFWSCLDSRQKTPQSRDLPLCFAVWFFDFSTLFDFHPSFSFSS